MNQWIPKFDDVFVPEEKHSIDTGVAGSHVFGGVLHAVGILATGEPPVYAQTMFQQPADWREPITIDRQSQGKGLHVVHLVQNDKVISQTLVTSSTSPEPSVEVEPIEMKEIREEEWAFKWGTGSDLMAYMTGYFRKSVARMWFKEHDMDLGAVASLADFGSIYLVPKVGAFGRTKMLTSHFTKKMPFEKSYVTQSIEGRGAGGVVFARLDQYDEKGQPVCLTRGVFRVANDDTNHYNDIDDRVDTYLHR